MDQSFLFPAILCTRHQASRISGSYPPFYARSNTGISGSSYAVPSFCIPRFHTENTQVHISSSPVSSFYATRDKTRISGLVLTCHVLQDPYILRSDTADSRRWDLCIVSLKPYLAVTCAAGCTRCRQYQWHVGGKYHRSQITDRSTIKTAGLSVPRSQFSGYVGKKQPGNVVKRDATSPSLDCTRI
jgi:hypothetical protein